MVQPLHDLFGRIRIVPKIGILGVFLKLYDPYFALIVVKDTPLARPRAQISYSGDHRLP
jgi:hypothetical protein